MSKVYLYPQKIFKYFGVMALVFGVVSCASSQSTVAASGETDGVYYSPSKDGQVEHASNQTDANAYDIQVGSPYFDANGNGAEDFYYDEQQANQSSNTQDVNIYTGGSNVYVASGATTDWGRYEGLDITVNNFGWSDPWWGMGYNSWGWGWGSRWYMGWGMSYGWNNPYWGWGGGWGWNNPYWGWGGGWHGYNPYWGNPYWGGGYYSGYYGNGYYHRGSVVNPGVRPGSNLAYGTPYRNNSSFRSNDSQFRSDNGRSIRNGNSTVRSGGVRSEGSNPVRPVRDGNLRENTNSTVRSHSNAPVRQTQTGAVENNIRTNSSNNSGAIRPVRQSAPDNVRPNMPVRTNDNIRTNTNIRTNDNIRTNSNSNTNIRSNSNISQPRNNSNSNNMRSSSPPSMRSGSSSGGMRSGGSSSGGGVRSGGRR